MQWPFAICDSVLNSSQPVQYSPAYSASNRSSGCRCWMRCSSAATARAWRGSVVRIQSSLLQRRRSQYCLKVSAMRSTHACGVTWTRAAAWMTDWLCSSIPMTKWTESPRRRR